MKKLSILSFAVFVLSLSALAQQDVQFSQNSFNRLATNPGYAGMNNSICQKLFYRKQWVGFPGAPNSYLYSFDSPVRILKGGVGLTLSGDQLAMEKTYVVKLSYSFHLPVGDGKLGIGVEGGLLTKTIRGDAWLPPTQTPDANIPQTSADMMPDIGFGLYYKTNDDKIYAGISSLHLLEGYAEEVNMTIARHYYLTGGYNWEATPELTVRPSIHVKTDAAFVKPLQFDFNANVLWNNLVWGGVSYRIQDAVVVMAGLKWGSLEFGYSYDVTTSKLNEASGGSHEFMVGYCFKLPEKKVKLHRTKSVRFL